MTFSAETISLIKQAILGACLLAVALFALLLEKLGAFRGLSSHIADFTALESLRETILILL